MKKVVGLVFGGRSGEHDVSIRSAKAVIETIDPNKYDVIPIGVTREGHWLNPIDSAGLFPEETTERLRAILQPFEGANVGLVGDPRFKGLTEIGRADFESIKIDVFFPVLHGTFGEDGTIQGLFEMAGVPYVGCGVLASSCGMDKAVMKSLFRDAGLPICKYTWFLRREWENDRERVLHRLSENFGLPCFVKPANLGSSVGISPADDLETLASAIDHAAIFDHKIIVEEALKMREIECAVLGNDEPEASRPGEYIIRNKEKAFLDYTEKYSGTGNNEFVVPAPVSGELEAKIKGMAIKAYKAINGSGLARVDFFLRQDNGVLLVNEINTMPGLTDASGFPKMWEGSGVAFREVIDRLIELAFERYADRDRNLTSLADKA